MTGERHVLPLFYILPSPCKTVWPLGFSIWATGPDGPSQAGGGGSLAVAGVMGVTWRGHVLLIGG